MQPSRGVRLIIAEAIHSPAQGDALHHGGVLAQLTEDEVLCTTGLVLGEVRGASQPHETDTLVMSLTYPKGGPRAAGAVALEDRLEKFLAGLVLTGPLAHQDGA